MFTTIINAFAENLIMVLASGTITVFFGLPLGFVLYGSTDQQLFANKFLHYILRLPISMLTATPYLMVLIFSLPFIKLLADKTAANTASAILPLSIATIPLFSLMIYDAIKQLPAELSITAKTLGATAWQTILKMYLPEILPTVVQAISTTFIQLLSFSILAGMFGAGGLGLLLMEKGYYAFDIKYLAACAVVLVLTTQFIQFVGNTTTKMLGRSG